MITTSPLFSNATSPLSLRERARRRAEPVEAVRAKTKRQIEVTMFAAGVEKLEGLKVGKLTNTTAEL
jgi:hypothetical protein